MKKTININVFPEVAGNEELIRKEVVRNLGISSGEITKINVVRRSIDARGRSVKINLGIDVFIGDDPIVDDTLELRYENVAAKEPIIIVGAGPAGLFCALRLIELGFKPILFERGKSVSDRKRDIASIHRNLGVNPDSNYGFGEGGAGTFSDGKLYTRSKKRGDITRILQILHKHGAQPEILIDAHPHIGTNILPRVIVSIRNTILDSGGEIHFNSRVVDFSVESGRVVGVSLLNGDKYSAKAVVLATGHSARDIYYLLRKVGIHVESKPFAVGVRVEHPQELIDSIQYHGAKRGIYLPPASYTFTEQVENRGVYSFCMCPGGVIVPAATSSNELVVNGMSPSKRNGEFANSGIVVEVQIEDLNRFSKEREFAGLKFQEEMEHKCFKMASNSQIAPAQRLVDFLNKKYSSNLPTTSYRPGIQTSAMHEWLPDFISTKLRQGFENMGRKARGFVTNNAVIMGVESRTSSPIRIPRNEDTFEHVKVKGIFPCGEGAGYAGGIVSSAMDGERCAEMISKLLH